MQRVLDLDLDFFVYPVVTCVPADAPRPDPTEYSVELDPETELSGVNVADAEPSDAAMAYLRERALLTVPLPGAVVEHHDKVFRLWEQMIEDGVLRTPFHVTHMDAHADFCTGDASHLKLFDVLRLPLEERRARSREILHEGNYLAHAVASQWISSIDYVYCPKGGSDIDNWAWENWGKPNWSERASGTLRLHPHTEQQISRITLGQPGPARYREPRVPFEGIRQSEYVAGHPFDFLFLCKSPAFTPVTADPLYAQIEAAFIQA